ncbi:MAG: hypothetical protein DRI48_11480 [Chloroflexi bacterium]|nr:MAG: hypothetical protein DRI48_11480 [Chloroflexota bacterium]
MDRRRLFEALADEEPAVLLDLLDKAYDEMKIDQRNRVFGKYARSLPPEPVDGEALLSQIEGFQERSLSGYYYEPFAINSKNWTYVPEETKKWFEEMGDYLKASRQLTAQGDHVHAVACFGILYELIEALDSDEEIVFAEEIGSWMIPGDKKDYVAAYMTSLAETMGPEEFTQAAIPLIRRDSRQSLSARAYKSAIRAANEEQRERLEAEVQRQEIRTEPWW